MAEIGERVCVGCSETGETVALDRCNVCGRYFCADCAHRAGHGRRFCSPECSRAYYFTGEPDDDEESGSSE